MSEQTAYLEMKGSVELGGSIAVEETISIEGVSKVTKDVAEASVDLDVALSPVPRDKIQFLMIKSSVYDDGTGKLTYKVAADATVYKLTTAHIFRGTGQAAFLPADPSSLKFSNSLGEDVTVDIFMLWDQET